VDPFVQRAGTQLVWNGRPYRFTGLNVYNANSGGRCGRDLDLGASLDAWGAGKEVVRAWFFQNLATTNGVRNWSAFDRTLAAARSRGYRVIATLANQWASCEQGYGYKTDQWYGGGYKTKDPQGVVSYRDWVAEVVARYKDDPTILMWQLMNEAEVKTSATAGCTDSARGSALLKAFAADVSGLIKSIDRNHLVNLGTMGGGTCGTQSDQYRDVYSVPTLDLCELHDYGGTSPLPGDRWNGMQANIDRCRALNKPLFVGEIGIRLAEQAGGSTQTRASYFDAKLSAEFGAGVVGALVWAWSPDPAAGSDVGPSDPALAVLGRH
jgi:mannan endo-1,4-beta-mannosidase